MRFINLANIPSLNYSDLLTSNDSSLNTFFYQNNLYYLKKFNLNEFIGEALAEKLNVRTVNYECFKYKSCLGVDIMIASKSFINPTSTYSYVEGNLKVKQDLDEYKNICVDDENFTRFIESIFKMFAIDIYMGQNDRHAHNCQIEKYDTGYIALGPLYDYSLSCFDDSFVYDNPFINFYDKVDYDEIFIKYPVFLELLKKIKSYDLIKIIHDIEESKGFRISYTSIEDYKKKEETTQKKLEKIIK